LRAIANTEQLSLLDLVQDEELLDITSKLVEAAEYGCLDDVVMSFAGAEWWSRVERQVLERLPQPVESKVRNLLLDDEEVISHHSKR
jgi:hypothetical protein